MRFFKKHFTIINSAVTGFAISASIIWGIPPVYTYILGVFASSSLILTAVGFAGFFLLAGLASALVGYFAARFFFPRIKRFFRKDKTNHFSRLPVELFVKIAEYLPTRELHNLMLTSTQIKNACSYSADGRRLTHHFFQYMTTVPKNENENPLKNISLLRQQHLLSEPFLERIIGNEKEEVEAILKSASPELRRHLLTMRCTITDYAGRNFKNKTAFQYTWWAWHSEMAQILAQYMLADETLAQIDEWMNQKNPEHGLHFDFKPLFVAYEGFRAYTEESGGTPAKQWYLNFQKLWGKIGERQLELPAGYLKNYCRLGQNIDECRFAFGDAIPVDGVQRRALYFHHCTQNKWLPLFVNGRVRNDWQTSFAFLGGGTAKIRVTTLPGCHFASVQISQLNNHYLADLCCEELGPLTLLVPADYDYTHLKNKVEKEMLDLTNLFTDLKSEVLKSDVLKSDVECAMLQAATSLQ